ncbi:Ig-like domain-containing protein [Sphaerisporangium sp. NPDC051011]|uniref:Ig-like domain-containing protein n=1 Tax=Sphaerisporangium sp. NPDC051011 TaxID=3155792 RepID=UPI0033F4713D
MLLYFELQKEKDRFMKDVGHSRSLQRNVGRSWLTAALTGALAVGVLAATPGSAYAIQAPQGAKAASLLPSSPVKTGFVVTVRRQISTNTTLTSSQNPSSKGHSVTFTATVRATGTNIIPTGTVVFRDGSKELGSAPLEATGQAAYSTSSMDDGFHNITAFYQGNASFDPSTSPVLIQRVEDRDEWKKKKERDEEEKKKHEEWKKKAEEEKKKHEDWMKKHEDEKKKHEDWMKKHEDEKKKHEEWKKKHEDEDEKKKHEDWMKKEEEEKKKHEDWKKKHEDEKKKRDDWKKKEEEKKKEHKSWDKDKDDDDEEEDDEPSGIRHHDHDDLEHVCRHFRHHHHDDDDFGNSRRERHRRDRIHRLCDRWHRENNHVTLIDRGIRRHVEGFFDHGGGHRSHWDSRHHRWVPEHRHHEHYKHYKPYKKFHHKKHHYVKPVQHFAVTG